MLQMVIIDALVLPARICGLIVAEDTERLLIAVACPIIVGLGKLAVGLRGQQLVSIILAVEVFLLSHYFVSLRVINSRFQKHREELKFFSLLLQLGSLDRTCRLHELVELVGSIRIIILFLLLGWRVRRVEVLKFGKLLDSLALHLLDLL
jgi:signal transduction histidine kinase